MPPTDLGEEYAGICVMEWVSASQHSVEHDAQTPAVGGLAGVRMCGIQNLWADISGTAMLVH